MHEVQITPRRRRAARLDFLQRMSERRTAAPLAEKLAAWHQRAVQLAAIGNRRLLHGGETSAVRDEAHALVTEVVTEIDRWHHDLGDRALTGEILDTERSSRVIVATLDALLRRLPQQ